MNKLSLTPAALALALALSAQASAASAGSVSGKVTPSSLNDRHGSVTIKGKYNCTQYAAPYTSVDDLDVSIIRYPGVGYRATPFHATCNGKDHQLNIVLTSFNGGLTGQASLQISHAGYAADGSLSPDVLAVLIPVTVR